MYAFEDLKLILVSAVLDTLEKMHHWEYYWHEEILWCVHVPLLGCNTWSDHPADIQPSKHAKQSLILIGLKAKVLCLLCTETH